jgi:hypothetical protein
VKKEPAEKKEPTSERKRITALPAMPHNILTQAQMRQLAESGWMFIRKDEISIVRRQVTLEYDSKSPQDQKVIAAQLAEIGHKNVFEEVIKEGAFDSFGRDQSTGAWVSQTAIAVVRVLKQGAHDA